jgi:ATP-dependent protease ClpP protease subunit
MLTINSHEITQELFASIAQRSALYFNVVSQNDNEMIIAFTGFVGDEYEGNDPKTFGNVLAEANGKRVRVQINSSGGLVNAGTHIYDLLSAYHGEIVTEVYGMTASAATIIAQAGKRRMSKNALMLIHHGWAMTIGNVYDHEKTMNTLKTIDQTILGIYEDRSPNKYKEIKDLMAEDNGDGVWINADQALELGLIDEVFTPGKEDAKAIVNESSQEDAEARSERIRRIIQLKKAK